jgi:hypothetical protein
MGQRHSLCSRLAIVFFSGFLAMNHTYTSRGGSSARLNPQVQPLDVVREPPQRNAIATICTISSSQC